MKMILLTLVITFAAVPFAVQGTDQTCGVVPIEIWSGSSSDRVVELRKPVSLVVVTHTVTTPCVTDEECERIANVIRTAHKEQGLRDIGLSFLIGENGKIYEGAGWKVGNFSLGYNELSISLSFIGDFRERIPSEAALKAAESFLGCSLNYWHLDYNYLLVGHRQLIPTISPGDALQNLIQTWSHWSAIRGRRVHKKHRKIH